MESARREPTPFETAADAIVAGDLAALRALVAAHPGLVSERSTREHRAPLLHYVAANGVEDERQFSPPNAVEIATILLDAGAEVDATSEAYGGGYAALGLVATSTPPRRAGVQIPLIHLLLARGAAIDGLEPGESNVRSALANDCREAAVALVDRGEYGGTVLDGTLWFAHHVDDHEFARRDFPAVIDALVTAGARTDLYPEMRGYIDSVYRRAREIGATKR